MTKRHPRAFTLVELLLGATVTVLIGLSAVTVSSVLSTRYDKSEAYYQSLQTCRSTLSRLQSQFHGAQLLTQASSSQITLWRDTNGDNQINPSELTVLTWNGTTLTQYQVVYPAGISQFLKAVLDSALSLDTAVLNPASILSSLANAWYGTSTTVASGLTGFSVTTDAAPPMTRLVTITVTSGQGTSSVTLRSVASLRGDKTGSVAVVNGHYALAGS